MVVPPRESSNIVYSVLEGQPGSAASGLLAMLAPFACISARSSFFTEPIDAGDFLAPQSVAGSGITQIQGAICDPDLIDAFKFHFAGGPLAIATQALVRNFNSDAGFAAVDLPITLFGRNAQPVTPAIRLTFVIPIVAWSTLATRRCP
jgi:hypothetical protein